MKNRRGLPLIAIGLLLVVAALSLSVFNVWDEHRAGAFSDGAASELGAMIPKLEKPSPDLDPSQIMYPDYLLNPNMDMPTVEVDGNLYIGILSIPVLNLELPVMSDWDYKNLKLAPCRYTGTAYKNDFVLAAHNYDRHFGRLDELQIGDQILFTDVDGNVFTYTAEEMEILGPYEIEKMIESDWDLTLFTCTLGGRTRFTVRCALVQDA